MRPVVIVSYRNTLRGAVTVLPVTSVDQGDSPWAVKLAWGMEAGKDSWVICDKPMTVAVSRLENRRRIVRLPEPIFNEIIMKLMDWLPKIPAP